MTLFRRITDASEIWVRPIARARVRACVPVRDCRGWRGPYSGPMRWMLQRVLESHDARFQAEVARRLGHLVLLDTKHPARTCADRLTTRGRAAASDRS